MRRLGWKCYITAFFIVLCLRSQWGIESSADEGFIIPHSKDVEYVRHSRPYGLTVSLVRKVSDSIFPDCRCFPAHHFRYMFFNFNNRVLGHSHILAYFLEPQFRLFKNVNFSLNAGAGFSYNNQPYHPLYNPDNNSYSLFINGYLGLGAGISIKPSKQWQFKMAFIYHHISNGGIRDPNKGINWPAGSVAYTYYLSSKIREKQVVYRYNKPFFDSLAYFINASVYGSGRIIDKGDKKRWPVYGLQAGVFLKISSLNCLFVEADFHRDHAVGEVLKRRNIHQADVYASVAGGHGFLLGRFLFHQSTGIYAMRPSAVHPIWYHRWGLMFFINQKLYAEIRLKAHLHVAHFLDFRMGYAWRPLKLR